MEIRFIGKDAKGDGGWGGGGGHLIVIWRLAQNCVIDLAKSFTMFLYN